MADSNKPLHPIKSITVWGAIIYVASIWWPQAAEMAADPTFWDQIQFNLGQITASIGALFVAFGIRRRLIPGFRNPFK